MNKKINKILIKASFFFCCLCSIKAFADDTPLRIKVDSYKGKFIERSYIPGKKYEHKGTQYFKKPNNTRRESDDGKWYMIIKGSSSWMFYPSQNMVWIKTPPKNLPDLGLSTSDTQKNISVPKITTKIIKMDGEEVMVYEQRTPREILKQYPKMKAREKIYLRKRDLILVKDNQFDKRGKLIYSNELIDIETNISINEKIFEIKVPKNAQIVDLTGKNPQIITIKGKGPLKLSLDRHQSHFEQDLNCNLHKIPEKYVSPCKHYTAKTKLPITATGIRLKQILILKPVAQHSIVRSALIWDLRVNNSHWPSSQPSAMVVAASQDE